MQGHREGWCLYKLGCKGPETYANCPAILFGDVGAGAWPVGTGHPCFGCTEQGVGFTKPIHSLANVLTVTPPTAFPRVAEAKGQGATAGAAALAGAVVGAGDRRRRRARLAARQARRSPTTRRPNRRRYDEQAGSAS